MNAKGGIINYGEVSMAEDGMRDNGQLASIGDNRSLNEVVGVGIGEGNGLDSLKNRNVEREDEDDQEDNEEQDEEDNEEHDDEHDEIDDESDDYLLSDENDVDESGAHDRMGYNATIADHSEYLLGTLNHALDSLELDKSLVIQAQLSGILNNENQKIVDKRIQVIEKLELLKQLFRKNFDPKYNPDSNGKMSVIGQLNQDIKDIGHRIDTLKNGLKQSSFSSMFGASSKVDGVVKRFPVEYNQARDKVVERQIDED